MNVLPDYNPWLIIINPYKTKLFRNRKIPRFDRNNPIMSWGQKNLFKKKVNLRYLSVATKLNSTKPH